MMDKEKLEHMKERGYRSFEAQSEGLWGGNKTKIDVKPVKR